MDFRKFAVGSQGNESHKGSENVEVCLFCDDFSYEERNKRATDSKEDAPNTGEEDGNINGQESRLNYLGMLATLCVMFGFSNKNKRGGMETEQHQVVRKCSRVSAASAIRYCVP